MSGVALFRTWLYSGSADGERYDRPGRSWEWLPNNTDATIPCRQAQGESEAKLSAQPKEPAEEVLIRAAGLNREEADVMRLQLREVGIVQIAAELRLSRWQVDRRVASAGRKLKAYAELIREWNR